MWKMNSPRCDSTIAVERCLIFTLHIVKTIVWARPGISILISIIILIVISIVISIFEYRYLYPYCCVTSLQVSFLLCKLVCNATHGQFVVWQFFLGIAALGVRQNSCINNQTRPSRFQLLFSPGKCPFQCTTICCGSCQHGKEAYRKQAPNVCAGGSVNWT